MPRTSRRSAGWRCTAASRSAPHVGLLQVEPYGSYNHSHGDQNSFIVNDRGKRLAIASGYYDGYRTEHWTNWYKQTRSANAITFDGGHGQGIDERRFAGNDHGLRDDRRASTFAVGRAEAAYGEALTLAQRSIAYIRPRDDHRPRHARLGDGAHVGVEHPRAEEDDAALGYARRDRERGRDDVRGDALCAAGRVHPDGPVHRRTAGKWAPEWHGTFATARKSQKAEFIALMRVGSDCTKPSGATAKQAEGGWQVSVDGKTVTFAEATSRSAS
jgi:uncharacterized Zn-binding protein involved in type VI secretion